MSVPKKRAGAPKLPPAPPSALEIPLSPDGQQHFRQCLLLWYRQHRRDLPWRGIDDPYGTWVSEIMLQQTRVDAVIGHYRRFLQRFPTVLTLALAPEEDVLALWSGLGYYRRARMMHRAARHVVAHHGGSLPRTAAELRTLPGIGVYTSAAIASIAFGEPVAVVDGNVERVLLRIAGRPQQAGAASSAFIAAFAQALLDTGSPGDSNQAMMELGATVCLPRGPLCLQCPVFDWCQTRGEHPTLARASMRSAHVGYALTGRTLPAWPQSGASESPSAPESLSEASVLAEPAHADSATVELLLHRRSPDLSLMAGMLELPPLRTLPTAAPRLRLRHGITGTNYYVEIFDIPTETAVVASMQPPPHPSAEAASNGEAAQQTSALHPDTHPQPGTAPPALEWHPVTSLPTLPLTGLARKVLQRTGHLRTPTR